MQELLKHIVLNFPPGFWVIFGSCLLFTWVIFTRSRKLIYSGYGAITTGLFLIAGLINLDNFFFQLLVFFLTTIFWAIAFLYPFLLKDYVERKYRYLVSKKCVVVDKPILKGKKGKASVDSKIYTAKIESDSGLDRINVGEEAEICNTMGKTLIIKPTTVPLPTESDLEAYRDHLKENPLLKDQ